MIALVTATAAAYLDPDLAPLREALHREGVEAVVASWDDTTVNWSTFEAVFLRSTWDYHLNFDAFAAWIDSTSQVTTMWNPPALMRWNLDKRYLRDLADQGIPIVETIFLSPEDDESADAAVLDGDVVVKATIGAGSHGVQRFRRDADAAQRYVDELLNGGRHVMVQPYLAAVDTQGETGIVVLGGVAEYAFEKGAILTGETTSSTGLYAEERITPRIASADERALAERVIEVLPQTAYARIDMLPTSNGPVVSEVELVEPSLFFNVDAHAAVRTAAAFASLLDR